ncbi:hypothetical protein [Flagellimonas okinawensis]|uniref:DUF3828 domain-containing protein n=1 Tax=Flagellimonas okinawensis TaxID=3031324 RepID=A0ABT5XRH6_9FLAO|nr:hypothetical protein [[Muricauda] okinawensis]MDF0708490.1 hypothetical protein [[Muricauda] okinawensis]
MKTITTIFFLIIFGSCYCQEKSDYEIYSTIIDNYFNRLDIKKKYSKNAVIIDRLDTLTNWASEGYEYVDYALFETRIDSVTRYVLKDMLSILKESYIDSPKIDADSLNCSIQLSEIYLNEFHDLFSKDINEGWERFYKTYPKSLGAFSFSNIVYSGDLAILFVDFKRHGLFASGDFYIMKKIDDKWIIYNLFNMYKA